MKQGCWILVGVFAASLTVSASPIDTTVLQQPWPRQRVRELEVGRYDVRWREAASRKDGIFAGVQFRAPRERTRVWELANDYTDLGSLTPGVRAVTFLERTPTRQVIQIDMKVLWKTIRLIFEVEQAPPRMVQFQLVNKEFGDYRGLCTFDEVSTVPVHGAQGKQTAVELMTWLKPNRPVPMGLLLLVERMTLLQGVKGFLRSCESTT